MGRVLDLDSALPYVTAFFPGLATVVTRLVPVRANGAHMGSEPWRRFLGNFFPTFFWFNDQHRASLSPHSFTFYQEKDNECTAIDFQGISAPRDRKSIKWIRDTFLSLIN